jgi:putative transposase
MAWAHAHGVRYLINDAGMPTQKAYIESFNGKFRDECLNEQWFQTLHQIRKEISRWRRLQRGATAQRHPLHPTRTVRRCASTACRRCTAITGG